MPKIPFLKLGAFFYDPFTITINGCKLSYILPFSCEIKMVFDWKKDILYNFTQFPKEKLQKSYVILEMFVFKNSDPKTQAWNLDPLKIKNNFEKLGTMTLNQFNFRPADYLSEGALINYWKSSSLWEAIKFSTYIHFS